MLFRLVPEETYQKLLALAGQSVASGILIKEVVGIMNAANSVPKQTLEDLLESLQEQLAPQPETTSKD